MPNGITFISGSEASSSTPAFKVEYGSYDFINDIIYEEVARGYVPVSISSDGRLCHILFKKRGV